MAVYKISCEVMSIAGDKEKCIGAAKMKKGGEVHIRGQDSGGHVRAGFQCHISFRFCHALFG
jgi:hypothetical protein